MKLQTLSKDSSELVSKLTVMNHVRRLRLSLMSQSKLKRQETMMRSQRKSTSMIFMMNSDYIGYEY